MFYSIVLLIMFSFSYSLNFLFVVCMCSLSFCAYSHLVLFSKRHCLLNIVKMWCIQSLCVCVCLWVNFKGCPFDLNVLDNL